MNGQPSEGRPNVAGVFLWLVFILATVYGLAIWAFLSIFG